MIRALDIWLPDYLRQRGKRRAAVTRLANKDQQAEVLFCVCDHFEPFHLADKATAIERVKRWKVVYPTFAKYRDSFGNSPRHTFFYPIEQYDYDVISHLADLCHETGCETEVHLHHENDTAETLRAKLDEGIGKLLDHGLLSRNESGKPTFGFIHGNWSLDNSDPDRKNCGVDDELSVLIDAGCYADFTMPSAPHRCQTRKINSIYYATPSPQPKSHDTGIDATVGAPQPPGTLLMVQGPLLLNMASRKYGLIPRIENGDLTGANPPTRERFRLWASAGISVAGAPEKLFVKVHTHGASGSNADMFLGGVYERFLEALTRQSNDSFNLCFTTADELVRSIRQDVEP